MGNQVVRTIRLSGEDAISFANSLFRPTREEIKHHREHINRINENVSIRRKTDGFEAEIEDLDLSFLDIPFNETKMNVKVTFELKASSAIYYSNERHISKETIVVERNNNYSSSGDDGFLPWAA